MKELTAGAEHARMQPLDATGYENDGGTAVTLPAGYSKALLLGDNTALPSSTERSCSRLMNIPKLPVPSSN